MPFNEFPIHTSWVSVNESFGKWKDQAVARKMTIDSMSKTEPSPARCCPLANLASLLQMAPVFQYGSSLTTQAIDLYWTVNTH